MASTGRYRHAHPDVALVILLSRFETTTA